MPTNKIQLGDADAAKVELRSQRAVKVEDLILNRIGDQRFSLKTIRDVLEGHDDYSHLFSECAFDTVNWYIQSTIKLLLQQNKIRCVTPTRKKFRIYQLTDEEIQRYKEQYGE